MYFFERVCSITGVVLSNKLDSEQKQKILLDIYNKAHNTTHIKAPGYLTAYENCLEPGVEISSDILLGLIHGVLSQVGFGIAGSLIVWEAATDATHLKVCSAIMKSIMAVLTILGGTLAMAGFITDAALKPIKVITRTSTTAVIGCKKPAQPCNNPVTQEEEIAKTTDYEKAEKTDIEQGLSNQMEHTLKI